MLSTAVAGVEGDVSEAGTSGAFGRLRELEAVTDTALGRLGLQEFLNELLRRVRAIVDADTAAVLLLDEGSGELVATAACGLEEEVHQAVHVPLGRGFAGRIAASKRPLALDRIDSTTVTNPILWEKGIRAMLGVPLLAGDDAVGVLHVGRLHDVPFTAQDTELLEVVAERVAGATQARQLALEQAAATLLERSLVPGRMPKYDGLELAARYITPDDRTVGGDWYDLFSVPSGRVWLVTGDVAGHGLNAAVVMGRVRSALRAYALLGGSPATVLELTDHKVQHFEIGTMVTVVCATSLPPYDDWQIATAGHPAPLIAAPDAAPRLLDLPVGPPLGVTSDAKRSDAAASLPRGAVMVLYTDGLIERRGESIDVGFERLRTAVRAEAPREVCRRVLHELIGGRSPGDDIAIVAIRRAESRRS
jgi:sigma-B regulation protein RsbU (phosphoserine phosphatase)